MAVRSRQRRRRLGESTRRAAVRGCNASHRLRFHTLQHVCYMAIISARTRRTRFKHARDVRATRRDVVADPF